MLSIDLPSYLRDGKLKNFLEIFGEVAERSKAAVLKTVVGVSPPGVRIPPSPLNFYDKQKFNGCRGGFREATSRANRNDAATNKLLSFTTPDSLLSK